MKIKEIIHITIFILISVLITFPLIYIAIPESLQVPFYTLSLMIIVSMYLNVMGKNELDEKKKIKEE